MTSPEALTAARNWLGGGGLPPADASACEALAWGLKALCDEAWNTDPAALPDIAAAAKRLAGAAAPGAAAVTVGAVARWLDGVVGLTRGAIDEAAAAFQAAHEALRDAGRPVEAAQALVPRIVALSMLGRHTEALQCGERALVDLQAHGERRAAAKVQLNLGNLQVRVGGYADALDHYRRAAIDFARLGDREHSIMADLGGADARAALGDFDDALRMTHRAGRRAELHGLRVLGALASETAALVYLACGRYRDALAGLESARRAYAALELPQHEATVEKQLADAYVELRLLPEAETLLEAALPRLDALELHVEAAWAHLQRARVLLLRGRPATEVRAELGRAAALFAQQDNPVGASMVDAVAAELLLTEGAALAARDKARDAAGGFERTGAFDLELRARAIEARAWLEHGAADTAHAVASRMTAQAAGHGLHGLHADALALRGRAAWALGRRADATADYAEAVERFEHQRAVLPDDSLRRAFLAQRLDAYEGSLRAALETGAPAAEVLRALEAYRARGLDDRLRGSLARVDDGEDQQVQALRARLDWWYRRAMRQREDGESADEAWRQAAALEAELREHVRRRAFVGGGDGGAQAPTADDGVAVCERLAPDEAVIAYGALDGELLAVSLSRSGLRVHRRLAPWPAVQEAIGALRFQIDSVLAGGASAPRHLAQRVARAQARLQVLHSLVWAPLEDTLGAPDRVLFVPYGEMAGIPFAALHDGREALLGHARVAQAHSIRTVVHGLERRAAVPAVARAWGDDARLPHAGDEARHSMARYPDGQARTGQAADVASFLAGASEADVLHLACHGEFRADNPAFSTLHLADGTLTVDAVAGLRLRAGTVVLGACDSARAAGGRGDEVAGFTRAFIEAGAARVVASLWPVADASSVAPMVALHSSLAAGRPASDALRSVQIETMRDLPHPFHWAGLAVYGGW